MNRKKNREPSAGGRNESRLRLEEYTDRDGKTRASPELNANDIQFLGQRVDTTEQAADRIEDDGQASEGTEKGNTSKSASPKSGKKSGSKRASAKEAAGIEEDHAPF